MASSSPERGRSRSRTQTSAFAKAQTHSESRSPRRTLSPRSALRSGSPGRSPSVRGGRRDGHYNRSGSRSRSPAYRGQSFSRSQSRVSTAPKSSKIVIEKLTKNVNENHLFELFGAYGPIKDLDLPMNRQFMTNRGTAYIIFSQQADAEAAIAHMHEAQLDGAIISVSIVLPRRKFSHSPPPARKNASAFDRFEPRGAPPAPYNRGPPPLAYGPPGGGRYRSPPPGRRPSPPRRYGGGMGPRGRDFDNYRPRSYSRSRSPRRTRSPSYSSRSRSPPRRSRGEYVRRRDNPPPLPQSRGVDGAGGRRRRSPSYSSYSSYSRSRSRSRDARNGRGR